MAIIKIRPEEIVRQHRVEMLKRINLEDLKKRLEGAQEAFHPVEYKNSEPLKSINAFNKPQKQGLFQLLFHGVNWDIALAWFCGISLSLCLWYLGIFVFAPFAVKLWK